MKFFALFFLASALIAAPTLAADHGHIASPIAQMLMHDSLYTSVRTSLKHGAHPNFKGTVKGNYEQIAGKGSYTGTFSGTNKRYKTTGKFNFNMVGSAKYMGLHATSTSGVKGYFHVSGTKQISVNAYYGTKLNGSFKGKNLHGQCSGKLTMKLSKGGIFARERGAFKVFLGGKLIQGKYHASIDSNSVQISVYGSYAGKPFFVNHGASLNLVALGMEMNPLAVQRNYGTVTGTAGGKKFVKKYDQKGNQMFPALAQ